MAVARSFSFLFFTCLLLLLLLPSLFLCFAQEDPQLQQCRRRCRQQEEGARGERERRECERTCEEAARQRQREGEGAEREREEWGGQREKLEHCRQHCREEHEEEDRRRCQERCQERYGKEREERRGREEEGEERNPYFFGKESFTEAAKTEHGHFKVLQSFSKRSELLRGIENYRIAVMEAEPSSFAVPSHWDADEILYVVKGRGVITILHTGEEKEGEGRESHEIGEGDVLWVPAGTIVYLINTDKNQKLRLAMVLKTISNVPGEFREFFGVGGRDPESFFRVFSTEILEAAFNTRREKLERVFGQHRRGTIVKASEEQIREMSKGASEEGGGGIWPFGSGERNKPCRLLKKKPSHSNQHGRMYELDQDEYKPLRELDVALSVTNITAGSMIGLSYNSRATMVAMVISGEGLTEMACPHLSHQQGMHYVKVSSRVSPGTMFVVPPGHPTVTVASSGGENLVFLCFCLRAQGNRKYYLTGKNSALRNLQRQAGELSLGVPWKEAKEVLDAQQDSVFFKGPELKGQEEKERGREQGAALPLYSILDVTGGSF